MKHDGMTQSDRTALAKALREIRAAGLMRSALERNEVLSAFRSVKS